MRSREAQSLHERAVRDARQLLDQRDARLGPRRIAARER